MKTVLVTGGSRGIGAAICRELGPDYHLLVGATTADGAEKIVAELPSAEPWIVDLTDEDATAQAVQKLSQLDVLVNNAGVLSEGTVAQASRAQWRHDLELNLLAPMDLTRLCLPLLRKSRGHVIFMNSGAGFDARLGSALYGATKFALRALADRLREEERGRVQVTSIHPGRVDTDMQRAQMASRGPYQPEEHMPPQAIAQAVRFALDSPANAMVETVSVRPVQLLD